MAERGRRVAESEFGPRPRVIRGVRAGHPAGGGAGKGSTWGRSGADTAIKQGGRDFRFTEEIQFKYVS